MSNKKEYNKKYRENHRMELREQGKIYHKKHRETILKRHKVWKELNKIKVAEYMKQWHQKNRDRVQKLQKKNRKENINVRLALNLRHRIWGALKYNYKSISTLKLLGCSLDLLRLHLQSKFQPGMSFSNYGKWHIDHIIPCASFDLSKKNEQAKCFHYTNLQPLWAEDNFKKSDKIMRGV